MSAMATTSSTTITIPQFTRQITVFAMNHLCHINNEYRQFWNGIESLNADLTLTSSARLLVQQITGLWKPQAVFLADNSPTDPANYYVRSKLVEYVNGGGIVFVGGLLPSESKQHDINALFFAFGLPWICGKDTPPEGEPVDVWITRDVRAICCKPMLSAKHQINGLFLRGVPVSARLYVERKRREVAVDNGVDAAQTIAAFQRVGSGYVGYLGDCEAADTDESLAIMMSMLNLWKDQSIMTCAKCGKNGEELTGLGSVHCGVCRRAHWCDPDCSEQDKKRHKIVCSREHVFNVVVPPAVAANPGVGLPGYHPYVPGQQ